MTDLRYIVLAVVLGVAVVALGGIQEAFAVFLPHGDLLIYPLTPVLDDDKDTTMVALSARSNTDDPIYYWLIEDDRDNSICESHGTFPNLRWSCDYDDIVGDRIYRINPPSGEKFRATLYDLEHGKDYRILLADKPGIKEDIYAAESVTGNLPQPKSTDSMTLKGRNNVIVELGSAGYADEGIESTCSIMPTFDSNIDFFEHNIDLNNPGEYYFRHICGDDEVLERGVIVADLTPPTTLIKNRDGTPYDFIRVFEVERGGSFRQLTAEMVDNDPNFESDAEMFIPPNIRNQEVGYRIGEFHPKNTDIDYYDSAGLLYVPKQFQIEIVDTTPPTIRLRDGVNLDDPIRIRLGNSSYDLLQDVRDAYDRTHSTRSEQNYDGEVWVQHNIDFNTEGKYSLTYHAPPDAYGNKPDPITRDVIVGERDWSIGDITVNDGSWSVPIEWDSQVNARTYSYTNIDQATRSNWLPVNAPHTYSGNYYSSYPAILIEIQDEEARKVRYKKFFVLDSGRMVEPFSINDIAVGSNCQSVYQSLVIHPSIDRLLPHPRLLYCNQIDFDTPGIYNAIITASINNQHDYQWSVEVKVVDKTPPSFLRLESPNPFNLDMGEIYADPGINSTDNDAQHRNHVFETNEFVYRHGPQDLEYSVTDPSGNLAILQPNRTINIIDNEPPVISVDNISPYKIVLDSFSYPSATATDNDPNFDGTVTITMNRTYHRAGNGPLISSPIKSWSEDQRLPTLEAGNIDLTYTATDPSGNTASVVERIRVEALPGFSDTKIERKNITEHDQLDFTVKPNLDTVRNFQFPYTRIHCDRSLGDCEYDPSQPHFYLTGNRPENATIDLRTGEFSWIPGESQDGTHRFSVLIHYHTAFTSNRITIDVEEVNEPPRFSGDIISRTIPENQELRFNVTASDPDIPKQQLHFSISSPLDATINATTGEFVWTPDETQQGVHDFNVTVSDGEQSDTAIVRVTVQEVNENPSIEPISSKTAIVGRTLAFGITANDVDIPEQDLTYSIAPNTTGAAISSGEFRWTPTEPGNQSFTITVADTGGASASTSFVVTSRRILDVDPMPSEFSLRFNVMANTDINAKGRLLDENDAEVALLTDSSTVLEPGQSIIFYSPPSEPLRPGEPYTYTFTHQNDADYTDPSAVSGTARTLPDTISPVITIKEDTTTIEKGGTYREQVATVTDNDPSYAGTVTVQSSSVDTSTVDSYTVTYTATPDYAGNEPEPVTETVRVQDTTAPTITIEGDNPLEHELGTPYTDPGATTDDGTQVQAVSTVDPDEDGSYTVTYTATDDQGNAAEPKTRTVNVRDTTPPTITITGQATVTVEKGSTYSDRGATVDDNDPDYTGTATVQSSNVNTDTVGTYQVTYTAPADEAGNAPDLVTRTVNVRDTTAPVITVHGDNPLEHELGTPYADPGATTNDGTPVQIASTINADQSDSYTITYTATDDAGNAAIPKTRTVNVRDTTPPTITITGQTTVTIEKGATYDDNGATVDDNDPDYTGAVTSDASQVDTSIVTTYTVTYTAPPDEAGNAPDTVTRTVNVEDTTAPTITLNGANPLRHELGDEYDDPGATADDDSTVTADTSAVNVNQRSDYQVTYTATDDAGNKGTETRTVQVRDTTPPVISLKGDPIQEVSVGTEYTELGATVDDNDPDYSEDATVQSTNVDVDTVGTYQVTYTAPADEADNEPLPVTRTIRVVPIIPVNDERTTPEETEISIDVLTNDPETRATISITSITMPENGEASHDGTRITYMPNKDYNGMDTLQYTITGGGTATVTIDVTGVNDPPVLENLESIQYEPSQLPRSYADTFRIADPDTQYGDTHNLSLDIDGPLDPSNVELSDLNSLDVTVPEDYRGLTTFTVTVTDSEGASDTKSVTLLVYEPLGIQSSGTIEREVSEHETLDFSIVDDPDVIVEALSFELRDTLPRGAELNLTTGEFVWTPDELQAGRHSFRVHADYYHDSFDLTIRIRVLEDNQPHTIEDIGDRQVDVHELLRFDIVISDADIPTDSVTCSMDGDPPGASIYELRTNVCHFELNPASYADTGTWNVIVTATDQRGYGVSDTFTLEVVDPYTPDFTLNGDDPQYVEIGDEYEEMGATAHDFDNLNYDTTVTIDASAVDTSKLGTYEVTYRANPDRYGNQPELLTREVIVEDTTRPVIELTNPGAIQLQLNEPYVEHGATVSDNDPAYTTTEATTRGSVDVTVAGRYTVTYTAPADQSGNRPDEPQRTVTVVDYEKPVITLNPPNPQIIEKGTPYTELGANVADNDIHYSEVATPDASGVNTDIVGTYEVRYTAPRDEANNKPVAVTREVIVQDTTAPTIRLNGANPLPHELGDEYDDPGATADDGSTVTADTSAVNVNERGDYPVTYTTTDDDGNTASATRTVQVRDTTPPVIALTGQATVTVEKGATYNDDGATVTDNDPDYSEDTAGSSNVDTDTVGTYRVIYTAPPDEAGNRPVTVSRTVNVEDTAAPVITVLGANPLQHELATTYNDPGATTDDDTPVQTASTVNINEAGSYTVTYTATDSDGNVAIPKTRTVNVEDTTAPTITITGQATIIVEKGSTYSDQGATVTDNDPDYSEDATIENSNVNTNAVGTYQVTYTAPADEAGNAPDTVTRTVNVRDTTPPTITVLGDNPLQHELGDEYDDPGARTNDGTQVQAVSTVDPDEDGSYTVTYIATDDQGNSAEPKTRTVNVRDTTPPTITITGQATVTVEKGSTYSDQGATVTDNDPDYTGTATVQSSNVNTDTVGTYQVTYTAPADEAGNAPDTVTRTVIVQDATAPIITVLGDNPLQHELGDEYDDPGATTNDGTPIQATSTVNADQSGSYTVTYTATDDQGNPATPKTRTVNVEDTTPPTITITGQTIITVEKSSTYSDQGATVDDNDPDYTGTATVQSSNVDTSAVGTYQVTYTADPDEAGNVPDTVTRTVTVRDTTAPTITLNGANPLIHELATPYDDPGATTDDGSTVTADTSQVNVNQRGDYPVTYTATDDDGNTGTETRTVQVRDTTKPTITITGPATITVEKGATYSDQGATVDDNDPDYTGTATIQSQNVDTSTVGTYQVTYTAPADEAGNAPDTVTRTVTVSDNTAPVIAPVPPNPLRHELGDEYDDPGATADDGSTVTTDDSAVNVNESADYIVRYTATDDDGNTGMATRTVEVRDTTKPTITITGQITVTVEKGSTYSDQGATVGDNDPDYTGTATVQSSNVNADVVGTYQVTYTAPADEAGNAPDTVTRTVNVRDTTAPVITITGASPLEHELGTPYTDLGATTDDGTPVQTASTVNINEAGSYTVTYTATDDDGNSAEPKTRTVNVRDTTPPTITITGQATITVEKGSTYSDRGATVDDNDPDYTGTATVQSSNVNTDAVGTYQVTYTAPADEAGNAPDTVTRTVNVRDTTAPVIEVLGANPLRHELGTSYTDPGARTNDGTPVQTASTVNVNEHGDYLVTYTATDDDGNSAIPATRTVQVRDTTPPTITITGDATITVEKGATYSDQGATVDDNDPDYTGTATVQNSNVDTSAVGTYQVIYTAPADEAGNAPGTVTRTVTVRDTTAPTITLNGANPLPHELATPYTDPGATASDGSTVTADTSRVNVNERGDYTVTYTATDDQGNTATPETRTVQVRDTTPPTITITGEVTVTVEKGSTYSDDGATVTDNDPDYSEDATIESSNVNTATIGTYRVTYTAPADKAGNAPDLVTRTVNVRDTTAPSITVLGANPLRHELATPYNDPGARTNDGTPVQTTSTVNVNEHGDYLVTYTATDDDDNSAIPATRTVQVRDTTKPTITITGQATITVEKGATYDDDGATVTDNDPDYTGTVTSDASQVDTSIVTTYTVTYMATPDEAGNAPDTVTRTVIVSDTTAPTITVLGANPLEHELATPYNDPGATTNDGTPVQTTSNVNTDQSGSYTVTYTATDDDGNSAIPKTRTVNVQDTTAPVITITGQATITVEKGSIYSDRGATVTDNDPDYAATATVQSSNVNADVVGTYQVTYTAPADEAGNAPDLVTRTVIVQDTTAPSITILGANPFVHELGDPYNDPGARTDDGTSIQTTSTVDVNTVGNYTVTYTATDDQGNAAISATRAVHVRDTTAPTITLNGANPLRHELATPYNDPGARTDDGSPVQTTSRVNINERGDYTVTYTATDGNGNTGMATRTVQVRDTTKPVIALTGPATVTVEKGATYSDDGATVTDNDPDYSEDATVQSSNVNTATIGTYQVTYTAPADEAGNAPDTVTRTVIVSDTTAPRITVHGANPLEHELATPYTDPGATTNDGTPVQTASTVNINEHGDYPVTYTATDDDGNSAIPATRTVQVRDTTKPVIALTGPATVTVEKGATYSDDGATVTDNDPDYTGTATVQSSNVDTSTVGTYQVTYTAPADEAGNAPELVTRTVNVRDTTAPTITLNGANPLQHELATPYNDPGARADDSSTVTADTSAVNVNERGDYPVTYTTTDDDGNAATATRTVEVRDTTKPVITLTGPATVTVEKGLEYSDQGATVDDNDPDYTGTATIQSSTVNAGVGTYTITYTAPADAAGNAPDLVTRTVNVQDTTAPTITVLGANPLEHELATPYNDPGARTDDGSPIQVSSTVDVNTVGNYIVTYTATDDQGNAAISATRAVHVRDTTAPVIEVLGANPLRHELGTPYTDPGARTNDGTPVQTASTVNVNEHGDYTVTYTATDDNDNTVTATRTVQVRDTTAPVITLTGPSTVTVERGSTYSDDGATVDDNDPDYTGTATPNISQVRTDRVGTYTVSYTAPADEAGNRPAAVTRTVAVQDTTAPTITLNGANPLQHELATPYTDPGARTNDGAPVQTTSTVNINEHGDYTVTYTATDDQNNRATATRTVQVRDTTPPSIRLDGANPYTIERGGTYDEPGAKVTDNDPDYTGTVTIQNSPDTSTPGTYIITYAAPPDEAGNEPIRASRAVIVQDTTAPSINLNGANPLPHELATPYNDPGATASDGSTVTADTSTVNVNERGDYTVTYTATDDEGNTGVATRIVQVRDTTAPVIVLVGPATVTIERGSTYADQGARVSDNDPDYTGTTTSDASQLRANTASTYTITYTAPADEAGNRPAPATRTVRVQDTTPPVIEVLGANPLMHEQGTPYTDPGATTDDGSSVRTISMVDINEMGDYTVTYTSTDGHGNTATPATRTVQVRDTIPPMIMLNGANPLMHELGTPYTDPGATANDGSPVTTDSSDVNANVAGTYTVTYDVRDAAGNQAMQANRTVIVRDTIAPVITIAGNGTIILDIGEPYNEPDATVTDNDPAYAGIVSTLGVVNVEMRGSYDISYTAPSDAAGNAPAPASRTVIVSDTMPPVLGDISDMTVYVGDLLEFTANATDDGPTLIFSLAKRVPDGATIDTDGAFAWRPASGQQGIHTITVSVSDGLLTDSQEVAIKVKDRNLPPDIPDDMEYRAYVDIPMFYQVPVSDDHHPDNPRLTFAVNGDKPENVTIGNETGVIMWVPSQAQANRTHDFEVMVDDGQYSDIGIMHIQVLEASEAPRGTDADYEWRKTPTFGKSFNTNELIVSCGYSMDETCRDVTDYHVDYKREVIQTNSTHDFTLKAYGEQVLQLFQIGFGMPQVGAPLNTAEALIEITISPNYTRGSTGYDVVEVVYRNPNNVIDEDAEFAVYDTECQDESELVCVQLNITGVTFREQMYYEPFAIFIMDTDLRSSTFYMNEGLLVEGESLNPAPTATKSTKTGNQADTISLKLTRTDKLENIWTDQIGNRWTQNEYGTWMMVYTVPKEVATACTDDENRYCDAFGDKMELHTDSMEAIRDQIFGDIYTTPAFDDLEEAITILDMDGDSRTKFLEQNDMMWIRNSTR